MRELGKQNKKKRKKRRKRYDKEHKAQKRKRHFATSRNSRNTINATPTTNCNSRKEKGGKPHRPEIEPRPEQRLHRPLHSPLSIFFLLSPRTDPECKQTLVFLSLLFLYYFVSLYRAPVYAHAQYGETEREKGSRECCVLRRIQLIVGRSFATG